MHKDITFLEDVTAATRQKVLNFVKDWNSSDEWLTVHTSGSTGKPKVIKLLKDKIRKSAKATVSFFNLIPNQTIYLALSTDYIAGKMMLIRALEHQLKIIVGPLQSNPLDADLKHNIDFSAFVPLQVQSILATPKSRANYESIKNVIIGGAPISEDLELELQTLTNSNYATFGMTETISHIALRNISEKDKHFTALPHVDFSLHKTNQLQIKAPLVCDDIIYTTDCVELLNGKQFIWKGRADFVVNSGGIKLHPEEIEKKIKPYIPNHLFYVMGKEDKTLGEKLVLKIQAIDSFDLTILQEQLKNALTKYELPKDIQLVSSFKMTGSGKIVRE